MPLDGDDTPYAALTLVTDMERLLTTKGWGRQEYSDHGRYCLVGALNKAQGRRPASIKSDLPAFHDPVAGLVLTMIGEIVGDSPIDWNDHYKRKKAEVLDVLNQTKAKIREKTHAV